MFQTKIVAHAQCKAGCFQVLQIRDFLSSIFRDYRTVLDSSKGKGGGVCIIVNKGWCMDTVISETPCSAVIELCTIKCSRTSTSTIPVNSHVP